MRKNTQMYSRLLTEMQSNIQCHVRAYGYNQTKDLNRNLAYKQNSRVAYKQIVNGVQNGTRIPVGHAV